MITRLESRTGLGIPDCLIAFGPFNPGFAMLELKVVKGGRKVRLSPHQVAFNVKHASLGCPVFILVQIFKNELSTPNESSISLFQGSQASELAIKGLETTPIASFLTKNIDWDAIKAHLMASLL